MKERILCFTFGTSKQADGASFSARSAVDTRVHSAWLLYPPAYFALYITKESGDPNGLKDYEKAAIYDACQKGGVDVIIDPQYVTNREIGPLGLTETIHCVVTGTGAMVNLIDKIEYVLPDEPVKQKSALNTLLW